ncbi:hypothetical protein AQUCO_18800001v1 [Aquilegia coerulea]|uniref:Uncharacterized protein n=1 Tax=Aquilegia coerulea TaxID=218851 RepID=A0A2G5C0P9_AQUCA|nr:hypothetical protein AQUCO_18800001v1 [Aquilegia coerulea]
MAHAMLPPLSPLASFINTPVLTFYVLGVFELEVPFDKPQAVEFLEHGFLPLSKRFSSIIVTDEKKVQRWKKVECQTKNHVIVPTFPSGLTQEEYDVKLEDYISDIYMEQLPENRPPWEVHLFMYPTSNAAGTMLFKLNHALGDGYSIMGALLTSFKRVDDPSLPLKFPSASSRLPGLAVSNYSRVSNFVYRCVNTFTDFTKGLLGTYLKDDDTVLRSKTPMVEFAPVNISSVTFSLDQIKEVKSKIGATVNDVTTGVIAYALQLYMKRKGQFVGETKSTALIVMNLRMYRGFKNLEEMLKANIWGNHFGFLTVSLPSFNDIDNVDPIEYVTRSKNEVKRRMNSMASYFTSKFLAILGTLRGPEAAAEYIHSNLRNTSIMISNMAGPVEKASMAGCPLNSFYFTVPGVPQSLVFTIVTYMGKLRLVVNSERGYIDRDMLTSCLKEAFTKIYATSVGEHPVKIE